VEIKRGRVLVCLGLAVAITVAIGGCASHGGAGATTGSLQMTDGGVSLKPGEHCGSMTACSTTSSKTYETCTVAGANCSERFITSDNQQFPCNSCTDCQAAAMMVTSWCGGSVTSTTGTTGNGGNDQQCAALSTSTACDNCCVGNHSAGNMFFNNALAQCECGSFGDCSTACAATFCMDPSTTDANCDACIQQSQSFGDCDETSACNANADCAALMTCINACPL
jgi:hypothetical protein